MITTSDEGDDGGVKGGLIAFLVIFILFLVVGASLSVYYYKTDPDCFKAFIKKLYCCNKTKNSINVEENSEASHLSKV